MRKFTYLLTLVLLLTAGKMSAQSFTMAKDTVTVAAYSYIDVYNNITNTTSDTIRLTWKIIYNNLPQSWKDYAAFGLCDNVTCYDKGILSGTTLTTDTIGAGKNGLFKLQINVGPATVTPTGVNPVYITAELSHGTTKDTVTFAVHKWSNTNVPKMNNAKDDVVIYPNPANNELNITFNKDSDIKTIAIYNLLGKQVSTFRTTGNSARLDIEKIPSGIYFVRLIDNAGHVVSTRRFTHQ